ncbi:MAG: hypothetical protein JOY77_07795 [Alphaproteobacteria bacterium]|nr:hypothetical protein [Alphaproteobacteria bacterium]
MLSRSARGTQPLKRGSVRCHVVINTPRFAWRVSTTLALLAVLGFVFFVLIDAVTYPWVEFACWATLCVMAVALSFINAFRYRSVQHLVELAAEIFVLASFHARLSVLFARGV